MPQIMRRHTLALCIGILLMASALNPASAEGSVGLAVAGSAFLINFYFGAMEVLLREGIITPQSPMGGLSGGAMTTMLTCAGYTPQQIHDIFKGLMIPCRQEWNKSEAIFPCQGQLWQRCAATMEHILPDDLNAPFGDTFQRCSNVGIAYTKLDESSNALASGSSVVVNMYTSNKDVRDALAATSFLSCSSACKPYILYKDHAAIDGGYTATLDDLCPTNVNRCIKMQVYYPKTLESGVACDVQGADNSAMNVPLECAKRDGALLTPCTAPVPGTFPFEAKGALPSDCNAPRSVFAFPGDADIYPGRFTDLNMSCFDWQCLSYSIEPDMLDKLYEIGKAEAEAWVEHDRVHNPTLYSSSPFLPKFGLKIAAKLTDMVLKRINSVF